MTSEDGHGRFLTFRGAPIFDPQRPGRAVFVGVPLETRTERHRMGSSLGPHHIRLQSLSLNRFGTFMSGGGTRNEFDPVERLDLSDWGDIDLHGDLAESQTMVRAAFANLARLGLRTVSAGGDGSVTLPQLQAHASIRGPLAVLHLDAHTDSNPIKGPGAANCFDVATREGTILAEATVHLGIRGHVMRDDILAHVSRLGHTVIHMDDWTEAAIPDLLQKLRSLFSGRPLYVCIDLDVLDPAAAPGVTSPSWGGLSVREVQKVLRSLAGLDVVAVDINTLNPLFDMQGTTAHLAASLAVEGLHLFVHAENKSHAPHAS